MAIVDGGQESELDGTEGRSVKILGKFAFENVLCRLPGLGGRALVIVE